MLRRFDKLRQASIKPDIDIVFVVDVSEECLRSEDQCGGMSRLDAAWDTVRVITSDIVPSAVGVVLCSTAAKAAPSTRSIGSGGSLLIPMTNDLQALSRLEAFPGDTPRASVSLTVALAVAAMCFRQQGAAAITAAVGVAPILDAHTRRREVYILLGSSPGNPATLSAAGLALRRIGARLHVLFKHHRSPTIAVAAALRALTACPLTHDDCLAVGVFACDRCGICAIGDALPPLPTGLLSPKLGCNTTQRDHQQSFAYMHA